MNFSDIDHKLQSMWERTYETRDWEACVAIIDRMVDVESRRKFGVKQIGFGGMEHGDED